MFGNIIIILNIGNIEIVQLARPLLTNMAGVALVLESLQLQVRKTL